MKCRGEKFIFLFIRRFFLNYRTRRLLLVGLLSFSLFILLSPASFAVNEIDKVTVQQVASAVNNLWVLVAGILVLMMQLGFAMLEAGLNESKNTVNVLFKNVMDACIGILIYFAFGYALMYRPENSSNILSGMEEWWGFSQSYFMLNELIPRNHLSLHIDFFFQAAFAATAATICSGAVAGRIKPWVYLLLTVLITGFVYPTSGYWVWGGGWLAARGFHDFAGSLVVHSVGGSAGLACVIILGARNVKFDNTQNLSNLQIKERLGHSLPLATIGMFLLWVGWYGFNAGSTLGIVGTETSSELLGKIVLNTTISACSSAFLITIIRPIVLEKEPRSQKTLISYSGKIELSMILNGILGGLVGITAICDQASPIQSFFIGAVSGVLVIFGVWLLNKLEIDDAVGAFPIHAMCGIWGGIAVGLFIKDVNFPIQLFGSLLIPAWSFMIVLCLFYLFNKFITKIRVDSDEEDTGLDFSEHNEYAYTYIDIEKKIAHEKSLMSGRIDQIDQRIDKRLREVRNHKD